jgi:hypothetical protein
MATVRHVTSSSGQKISGRLIFVEQRVPGPVWTGTKDRECNNSSYYHFWQQCCHCNYCYCKMNQRGEENSTKFINGNVDVNLKHPGWLISRETFPESEKMLVRSIKSHMKGNGSRGHARPVCRHHERPNRLYDIAWSLGSITTTRCTPSVRHSMKPGIHHNHTLYHEKSISKNPIFINFIIYKIPYIVTYPYYTLYYSL